MILYYLVIYPLHPEYISLELQRLRCFPAEGVRQGEHSAAGPVGRSLVNGFGKRRLHLKAFTVFPEGVRMGLYRKCDWLVTTAQSFDWLVLGLNAFKRLFS